VFFYIFLFYGLLSEINVMYVLCMYVFLPAGDSFRFFSGDLSNDSRLAFARNGGGLGVWVTEITFKRHSMSSGMTRFDKAPVVISY